MHPRDPPVSVRGNGEQSSAIKHLAHVVALLTGGQGPANSTLKDVRSWVAPDVLIAVFRKAHAIRLPVFRRTEPAFEPFSLLVVVTAVVFRAPGGDFDCPVYHRREVNDMV